MKRGLHQLNEVELLIELENNQSPFRFSDIKAELNNRQISKEQLQKLNREKEVVLNQRRQKAGEPLSLIHKIEIIFTPFGIRSKPKHMDIHPEVKEREFLKNAGFDRKLRERLKYQRISVMLWTIIFLLILIWALFRQ